MSKIITLLEEQANSENCGPLPGNNFDIEVGQGHGMVQKERACHKDHVCQISMLYHCMPNINALSLILQKI